MENLQQPSVIPMPFANNGLKNTIPSAPTGTNKASFSEGFPQITSESMDEGGIPPERADMNALGNVATAFYYFMQCGGMYTYSDTVATAIGGYPLNAILWYFPANSIPILLQSTKVNNTSNFNSNPSVIGTDWVRVNVTPENFVTLATNQTINSVKTFSQSPLIPTPAVSSNDTTAVNSAWFNNKWQKTNALPQNADPDIFYFIV